MFPRPVKKIVGAVGRLSPEKGYADLVRAAERVARRDRGIGFVLFGDGPLRDALERQVAEAGLCGRFALAGFRHDVGKFLPFIDVMAQPSFTEGLPVAVLEAFAAGVPVVATAVGGTPEVIENGVDGRLVPPGDPSALAESLLHVLDDDERRRRMGKRAREKVLARFTFEAQSTAYLDLIRKICRLRQRPAVAVAR
jgi:glycosyltransferase involved in cell wall biosynthesis